MDFLVIAIGQRREARGLGDQHPHHFAAALVLDDVLIDETELGAQSSAVEPS